MTDLYKNYFEDDLEQEDYEETFKIPSAKHNTNIEVRNKFGDYSKEKEASHSQYRKITDTYSFHIENEASPEKPVTPDSLSPQEESSIHQPEEFLDPKLDPDYRRDSFEYVKSKSPAVELPVRPHSFDIIRKADENSFYKKSKSKHLENNKKQGAVLFSLWERDTPQQIKSELSDQEAIKGLPSTPTVTDLKKVIFSISNTFEMNEIVLVPRTRGGFSYARVTKTITKKNCYFDSKVEHKNIAWRVVYSSSGKSLFKELPSPHIGKLKGGPSLSEHDMNATLEAEDEEFASRRPIGESAQFKDLQNVVFSPSFSFSIDEIVLIPRSSGGFTYGKVLKETNLNCRTANTLETHPLQGWRVLVGGDVNNPIRKDLVTSFIGKLTLVTKESNYVNSKHTQSVLNAQAFTTVDSKLALIKESEMNNLERKNPASFIEEDREKGPNEGADEVVLLGTAIDPKKYIQNDKSFSSPVSNSNAIGGLLQVDKKAYLNNLLKPKTNPSKHLIVIDGPNVAKKHGKETEFSAKGIKIALDYWLNKGHDAIAFVPEHYVRRKPGQEVTLKEYFPLANNLPLLNKLIEEGRVILTPPQDYDDSYCIQYAMSHNGCIVTNDRYNDHIEKAKNEKGNKARKERLKWIRDHCISFTFVRDDFLPNPDFKFPDENITS